MKLLCELIGRKQSANTSPKALIRQIARSSSTKLTDRELYWLKCIVLVAERERLIKEKAKQA